MYKSEELKEALEATLLPGKEQWVATLQEDGVERDFVNIGDVNEEFGASYVSINGYPDWGDDGSELCQYIVYTKAEWVHLKTIRFIKY